ncbi:MAG: MarR family transcriptional regulator [Aquisalimonadaceae bacterium]
MPRTLYLIHVFTHATRSWIDDELKGLGFTSMQFTVLSLIRDHPGITSADLSRRFYVSPQTMGNTIFNLEDNGLLSKRADDRNRRFMRLQLTTKGGELVAQGDATVSRIENELFGRLSPEDVETMHESIAAMLARLRGARQSGERVTESIGKD